MSTTDESENLLDHLTKRINPNGWRVISNPTLRGTLRLRFAFCNGGS